MPRVLARDALIGSIVTGGFGIAWAFWAASGLAGVAAAAVRISGVVVGAVIIAGAAALLRRSGAGPAGPSPGLGESRSMFRSRGFVVTVAVELVAFVAGNVVLNATGQGNYVAAWTAFVVGAHFIGFGRLFAAVFYWLGGAFIVAAAVGAAAGATAGTIEAVEAWTGLIAAASLFVSSTSALLASRPTGQPTSGQ